MTFELNMAETSGPLVEYFRTRDNNLDTIVPICPYSFMVNKSFLRDYLSWIAKKTSKNAIVVGAFLERHNYKVFHELSGTESLKKAIDKGRRIRKKIDSVLSECKITYKFRHIRIQEILKTNDFKVIFRSIVDYQQINQIFNEDLEEQVLLMLHNRKKLRFYQKELNPKKIETLKLYLKEEIAFYLSIYKMGIKVEIYPGRDLQILKRIAYGEYKDFPVEYHGRTHISLKKMA